MRTILKTIFMLLPALLLISCSANSVGGPGTGAETTNGYVVASSGVPVVNANVIIVDRGNWHDDYPTKKETGFVYASAKTDSLGRFAFTKELPTYYNIQIEHDGEGVLIQKAELVHDTGKVLSLKRFSIFTGSIDDPHLEAHTLFIAGTNYKTVVKSNGHFDFNNLSEGKYPVFADPTPDSLLMVRVLKMPTDSIISQENIPVLKHSVAVEDFQTGKLELTTLGRSTGSEWYSYNDNDTSNDDHYFNSTISKTVNNLGDGEYALHYATTLFADFSQVEDSLEKPYTGIGFTLGESYVDEDTTFEFQDVDSITFKAKGNGVIRLKIGNSISDSVFGGEWNDFGAYVDLEERDEWREYSITPDMLAIALIDSTKPGFDLTWQDVYNHVTRIEFEFNGKHNNIEEELNLWIDDIEIHGINLEQLVKYRETR